VAGQFGAAMQRFGPGARFTALVAHRVTVPDSLATPRCEGERSRLIEVYMHIDSEIRREGGEGGKWGGWGGR
jgi:hypothetical protein